MRYFNPRSREGSDTVCSPFVISSQYFNPRSREGSDLPSWCIWSMASIISIHAPARGATSTGLRLLQVSPISIHAPARGATKVTVHFNQNHSNISIHAPARGATGDAVRKQIQATISIHAPARGATAQSHPMKLSHKFQSTLPRGERLILFVSVTVVTPISIHAPARGATLSFQATGVNPVYFNPRSREGSDSVLHVETTTTRYFNPRSREGSDIHSQS